MKSSDTKKKIAIAALLSLLITTLLSVGSHFAHRAANELFFIRNIMFPVTVVLFSVLLFLLLRDRHGTIKSVFLTLLTLTSLCFLCGALLTSVFAFIRPSSVGITAVSSLYYYLLGFMIMLCSAAVLILTLLVFLVIYIIRFVKNKSKSDTNN